MFGLPEWALGVALIVLVTGFTQSLRRGPGRSLKWRGSDELERRIADLEEGQRQLSAGDTAGLERRIEELEERLDFAERMLARKSDAERLGPPKA